MSEVYCRNRYNGFFFYIILVRPYVTVPTRLAQKTYIRFRSVKVPCVVIYKLSDLKSRISLV